MKVCIIDDIDSNSAVIAKFLKIKGHEAVTTFDPKEGLSLLENEIFDVTLLDIDMPELSGIEIVDALQKSGRIKDQKIVIFTASAVEQKIVDELKEKGVKDYLKKPMELDQLIRKLEEITKS